MVGKRIALICIVLIGCVTMAFNIDVKTRKLEAFEAFEGHEPIVVLELFTSQGCSSCPPADVLLQQVKREYGNSVYALSYHVDYWNYIGWKDPFSKSDYTEKQRKYNIKLKSRSNYTPQVVVNGKAHFVGSNSSKMKAAIKHYGEIDTENTIVLSLVERRGSSVSFNYELGGDVTGKNLRAILVLDERTTVVKRGENRNRTLKNSNIVVGEKNIEIHETNGKATITIPDVVENGEKLSLIVVMETTDYDITAAAKTELFN